MDRIEKLRNLLVMALADRSMTDREIQYLSDRAAHWGLTTHQFTEAIHTALEKQGNISIPETQAERMELLGELMKIMAADGKLADVEKELFARAAVAMNVSLVELNRMIDKITA